MNILYYCDEYPPARNGGIGSVVKIVAEEMCRLGHKVIVVGKYLDRDDKETIETINGVTVIRWHKGKYNSPIFRLKCLFGRWNDNYRKPQLVLFKTQHLLKEVIDRYGIDIVEVPDYVDDFFHYDSLRSPVWDIPIPKLIRVHGSVSFLNYYLTRTKNEEKIRQDQDFFRQSNAICAVSSFSKEYVQKYICLERVVDVIYNPIESHWFNSFSDNSASRTILFFGKIAEMKGAYSLIKAFNLIAMEFPGIRLKLIGNGDLDSAKRLVDHSISDRVLFSGFIPKDLIKEEIDNALFCVLPSYFENFSMAALEVLARNRALIYTSRTSGPELIKDMENGILVDPEDIEGLADKMKLLLSDISLRNYLAKRGHDSCKQRFSTDVIIPQLEKYYEGLIRNGKN